MMKTLGVFICFASGLAHAEPMMRIKMSVIKIDSVSVYARMSDKREIVLRRQAIEKPIPDGVLRDYSILAAEWQHVKIISQ